MSELPTVDREAELWRGEKVAEERDDRLARELSRRRQA